mgnify:FL=1
MSEKKKMDKKSQAALEFLMTYGWAILVVLVAIAALAYFGVLSPCKFVPSSAGCEKENTTTTPICYSESYPVTPIPYTCNQIGQALLLGIGLDIKLQPYKICTNGTTIISNQTDGEANEILFYNIKDFYRDECLLK